MSWQDITIAIVQGVFVIALIPTIVGPHKPAFWTCAITAVGMAALTAAFGSLQFWWAWATSTLSTLAWGYLAGRTCPWWDK